jgi:hypothetical protein
MTDRPPSGPRTGDDNNGLPEEQGEMVMPMLWERTKGNPLASSDSYTNPSRFRQQPFRKMLEAKKKDVPPTLTPLPRPLPTSNIATRPSSQPTGSSISTSTMMMASASMTQITGAYTGSSLSSSSSSAYFSNASASLAANPPLTVLRPVPLVPPPVPTSSASTMAIAGPIQPSLFTPTLHSLDLLSRLDYLAALSPRSQAAHDAAEVRARADREAATRELQRAAHANAPQPLPHRQYNLHPAGPTSTSHSKESVATRLQHSASLPVLLMPHSPPLTMLSPTKGVAKKKKWRKSAPMSSHEAEQRAEAHAAVAGGAPLTTSSVASQHYQLAFDPSPTPLSGGGGGGSGGDMSTALITSAASSVRGVQSIDEKERDPGAGPLRKSKIFSVTREHALRLEAKFDAMVGEEIMMKKLANGGFRALIKPTRNDDDDDNDDFLAPPGPGGLTRTRSGSAASSSGSGSTKRSEDRERVTRHKAEIKRLGEVWNELNNEIGHHCAEQARLLDKFKSRYEALLGAAWWTSDHTDDRLRQTQQALRDADDRAQQAIQARDKAIAEHAVALNKQASEAREREEKLKAIAERSQLVADNTNVIHLFISHISYLINSIGCPFCS